MVVLLGKANDEKGFGKGMISKWDIFVCFFEGCWLKEVDLGLN